MLFFLLVYVYIFFNWYIMVYRTVVVYLYVWWCIVWNIVVSYTWTTMGISWYIAWYLPGCRGILCGVVCRGLPWQLVVNRMIYSGIPCGISWDIVRGTCSFVVICKWYTVWYIYRGKSLVVHLVVYRGILYHGRYIVVQQRGVSWRSYRDKLCEIVV